MFKGYVPTRGKRSIEKVKGKTKFYSLEQVQHLNEYGGVLNKDLIMVDVDIEEQAKIVERIINDFNLKCHRIKTSRGMHFYFTNTRVKRNKIGHLLACGLEADIKLGSNNTVVPLKIDGVQRDIIYSEIVDPLPMWLFPIDNAVDFFNMGEGDGRNQELFNYILKLQSAGFTKEDVVTTIKIINKYVLKQSLDQRELDVILRDEAFDKIVFINDKGKLDIERFCQYLINERRIVRINDKLHVYQNGIYTDAKLVIQRAMYEEYTSISQAVANEVQWKLLIMAPHVQLSPPTHIVLGNGLYNISTRQLEDFSPDYICKNKVATNYNPEAYSKDVDDVLDRITCNDKELKVLLEEVVGYTLIRRNQMGKAFILTGTGANGKSTFLEMIEKMIGEENISSLSLQELGQRFKTAELFGKLVNIGDDIPSKYIEDNSVFKKLVTGEKITVERKGTDPFDFRNYAKLFFSANEMPEIQDFSYGLLRRLVIIPFNADFKSDGGEYDPFIIDKLTTQEALEYLLMLGIQGLTRVLENQQFTEPAQVRIALNEYNLSNNPVLQFIEEAKIENELVPDVYRAYQVWCFYNSCRELTKNKFNIEIKKHYNTDKVWSKQLKKSVTIYVAKK